MIYILIWLQASMAGEITHRFRHSSVTCAALLESIEHDTDDYGLAALPEPLPLRLMKGESQDLFELSRRVWDDVADRERLKQILARFEDGKAETADEEVLHERRSRLKNLRFAFTLFDREHGEGDALNELAKAMGLLRDAGKTGNARWFKRGLRDMEEALTRERWDAMNEELDGFHAARPEKLSAFQVEEVERLREFARHSHVTGEEFHEMRKIVARFGALYGLLRARCPNERIETTYRYLSTLNGRMGARHDEIVQASARDEMDYARDKFMLPPDLRDAIAALRY